MVVGKMDRQAGSSWTCCNGGGIGVNEPRRDSSRARAARRRLSVAGVQSADACACVHTMRAEKVSCRWRADGSTTGSLNRQRFSFYTERRWLHNTSRTILGRQQCQQLFINSFSALLHAFPYFCIFRTAVKPSTEHQW